MENIKRYWEENAKKYGSSHWASWGDRFAINLEIESIAEQILPNDYVLDIGCANGYSTAEIRKRQPNAEYIGMDYSEAMIAAAKSANHHPDIKFMVGDIRHIAFPDNTFDVVYTTRVLINLPTWEEQVQGIRECLRVVKPGGKVVLSEGFWEPLVKLNTMRFICGLDPLVEHDFNRYLKQSRLEALLAAEGVLYAVNEFSSVYYIGSRLLRELFTDPEKYEGYENPVNQLFYTLSQSYRTGGFGIQIAYIINK